MSEESSDTPSNPPRASRFKEHTNTSNSIRPPPDELWKDLGIDNLIDKFNEENEAPPTTSRKSSRNTAPELRRLNSDRIKNMQNAVGTVTVVSGPAQPVATGQHEGTFGRLQRAWASMFGSVLGKRKAGAVDAEKDKAQQLLDDRKKAAEAAYHEAKELGLLPTPKVFVRPGMAAMSHNCATPVRTPRTPSLYRTPSKKDLQKQKRLSKRVSNLESKLASARKELQSVLHNDLPPVPPLPAILPPTPATNQDPHEHARPLQPSRSPPPIPTSEPIFFDSEPESRPASSSRSLGKLTKKRKVRLSLDDAEYIPAPTDSEGDMDLLSAASEPEPELEASLDSERTIKRAKSSASSASSPLRNGKKKVGRKPGTRLQKRNSLRKERDELAVVVVPDVGLGCIGLGGDCCAWREWMNVPRRVEEREREGGGEMACTPAKHEKTLFSTNAGVYPFFFFSFCIASERIEP
ncbi:hypothetical protein T440DRAFT_205530 [Plenodomus tracheiphilus IPT5]|uniref:Uncharacterized protein n=1 Tax=Plenodomus tracheiphilus IPT5 TaxID=1408161 RepID=A0A6A7BIV3_9PLEO|nr:hypothetical protein T440DRAFT_205530 [Plenodomus tracheiphilus IPT5]